VAGSHRAERAPRARSSLPRWAVLLGIAVALVPAAVIVGHRVWGGASSEVRSTDQPIRPVTSSTTAPATASPTPSPATSPSAQPTTPAPVLTKVAPDTPRRIIAGRVLDSGFDSAVTTLDPASTSEVARWGLRGSPGSPGTDTVYVVGSMRSGGAFEPLGRLRDGSRVSIRTDSGTVTYTVQAQGLKPYSSLRRDPLFTEHAPGRLVLVGIRYAASGARLPDALIVTAQLSSAEKA